MNAHSMSARPRVRLRDLDASAVAREVTAQVVTFWTEIGRVLGVEDAASPDGQVLHGFVEGLVVFAQRGATAQFGKLTPAQAFAFVLSALFLSARSTFREMGITIPRDQTLAVDVVLLAALGRIEVAAGRAVDRRILEALAGEGPPSFAPDYFHDEDIGAIDAVAWLRRVGVTGLPDEAPCAPPR